MMLDNRLLDLTLKRKHFSPQFRCFVAHQLLWQLIGRQRDQGRLGFVLRLYLAGFAPNLPSQKLIKCLCGRFGGVSARLLLSVW